MTVSRTQLLLPLFIPLALAWLSLGSPRRPLFAAAGAQEADRGDEIVLIKRGGVLAFEEVAEAFTEHFRVRVRQVQLDDTPASEIEAKRRVQTARLVVAVGQPAVNVVAAACPLASPPLLYAMSSEAPAAAVGSESSGAPELLFRALLQVRPQVQHIGALSSRRGEARLLRGRQAAHALGLHLVEKAAETGPQAIAALHELVDGDPKVDALWIGADPELLTTPVFQYLLRLQLKRGIPILAATRQQVRSGALLSVDFSPSAVGRRLAALTNLVLDGVRHPELSGREDPAGVPAVTLNGLMAKKLGLDLFTGRTAGWRVE
jgi:ABC-type uncharacterized transport system substrate-binding protein